MVMYAMFYDNMFPTGKRKRVAVAFASEKQLDNFVNRYEHYGGFTRFNFDRYGNNKIGFLSYYHLGPETKIQKKRGIRLFTYLERVLG